VNREQDKTDFDKAAVWRAAHQRRAEDLGAWLGALPSEQTAKAKETAPAYPAAGQPQPI
jgi:hypothetical protein